MEPKIQYQELHADRIVETIGKLSRRIEQRFPHSGLFGVSEKLSEIGRGAQNQATWIARPIISLRVAVGFLLAMISEMLSLLGKIAALYVQWFDDPAALAAVNEIENLTTGLSRKIWQKLMFLHGDGVLRTTSPLRGAPKDHASFRTSRRDRSGFPPSPTWPVLPRSHHR